MNIGNYNISDLTEVLKNAMSGVSANIFTDRPTTLATSVTDFAIVEFPTTIYDRLGYGYTSARVTIYAKEILANGNSYENILKLKSMQTAVYTALPINNTKCNIGQPRPVKLGKDKLGFHAWAINLDVIIK